MHLIPTLCSKSVGGNISCSYCNSKAIKHGKTKTDAQRYRCKNETCRRTFLFNYTNKACLPHISYQIQSLLKESCGIRGIGRLLHISNTTVLSRIRTIAKDIIKPPIALHKSYEVNELCTYYKNKTKLLWLVYAIDKNTGSVADFAIGSRTKATLNKVVGTLLMSQAKKIFTDQLCLYTFLIPQLVHCTMRHGTNQIERRNLTLRTHLKRLNRRTICFSRSKAMLTACLKIYFWS